MLPQFNTAFFLPQLFWLAICFGIFYLSLTHFALPRIAEVLSERKRRIDDDLDKAVQLKMQVDVIIQTYEQTLANARVQAHKILQSSHEELARFVQASNSEVAKRLRIEVKAGEERIAAAKVVILGQVKEVAAIVVETTFNCVTGFALDTSYCRKAVTNAMIEGHL